MKGNQLILLILLFFIITGIGTYLYLNRNQSAFLPASMALPESTVMAFQGIKAEDGFNTLRKQEFFKFLKQNESISNFEKDYNYLDSILNTDDKLKSAISLSPVVISLHVTTADDFQLLFLQQTNKSYNNHDIENLVKTAYADTRVIEHVFEETTVFEIKNNRRENLFSFALINGIVSLSRNTELVEESVHAFHANKSKNNPLVSKMVSDIAEDKIYINFARVPDLINLYTNSEYHPAIKDLSYLGSFGAYTYSVDKDKLQLNGTASAGENKEFLWGALLGQKPKSSGIAKILPISTGLAMSWCVDSFSGYFARYKDYLKANKTLENWEKDKVASESGSGINIVNDLAPLIGPEWGYACLETNGENLVDNELLFIKLKDTLLDYQNFLSLNEKIIKNNLATNAEVDYKGSRIFTIACANAFPVLLGNIFKDFVSPHFCRVGDYIVLSPSATAIGKCLDAYAEKQSLSGADFYKSFLKTFEPESNFLLFINPQLASETAIPFVKPNIKNKMQANLQLFKGFNAFGFQLCNSGSEFKSHWVINRSSSSEGHSDMAWSLKLESDLKGTPQLVQNYESGKKEVMVQDQNNTLYLISNTGTIAWKRQLNEPIAGKIEALDLYKNQQSEFLFATTSKIYVINHNGKDVGGYPLNLPEQTHTGLSLFDFNQTKDYSYFVCCDKGKIYGYYGNGRPMTGWAPMQVSGTVPKPLSLLTVKGKSYVYGLAGNGTFYLWNEKGNSTMKPVSLHGGFKNPVLLSLESRTFICTDTTGNMYSVSFEGSVQKKTYPKFRNCPFLAYIHFGTKHKPQYVLSSGNLIAGFGSDTSESWRLITSEKINFSPITIETGQKSYIGYVSKQAGKVYLFTPTGIPFAGFPRQGNSNFVTGDIQGNHDIDMIIGGPEKMLYHYRLSQ